MKSNKDVGAFIKKKYWLCGASRGIGFAVAEKLAQSGAEIVLMARNEKNLLEAQQKLTKQGASKVSGVALDIGQIDIQQKVASTAAQLGPFDGVLLNGGGPHGGQIDKLQWNDFDEAHRLLLSGPANTILGLLPYLKDNASIVAISSTTVKEPNPNLPLSATYRTGLMAFLKNLADFAGARGIRVNAVAPGYTATEKLKDLAAYQAKLQNIKVEDVYREWAQTAPLKRIAEPTEVANVCAFLFSTDAGYITGQTIFVDGGSTRGY